LNSQAQVPRHVVMPEETRILIFAPTPGGGLAEHVFYQARALQKAGCQVRCLTTRSFLAGRKTEFELDSCLSEPASRPRSRIWRRLMNSGCLVMNQLRLAAHVWRQRPQLVLLESYAEYLAPVWFLPHFILGRLMGFTYIANLHDPVRRRLLGPGWWHRLSVWCAYLPLRAVMIHQAVPAAARIPEGVKAVEVPVGVYEVSPGPLNPRELRKSWNVPEGRRVFLLFGQIRDGKNIDLVLQAAARVPGVFMVVVGSAGSSKDKPPAFYHSLANELKVADRFRCHEAFVPDCDVGAYFAAADFVLLTYSAEFISQSGILNIAAGIRKLVLASSGPSPFQEAVERYQLGKFVRPDSAEEIAEGMRALIQGNLPPPRWNEYQAYASWETNARGILQLLPVGTRPPQPVRQPVGERI
jgi:glycosyltransferase involved in cell wall biosynthesis